MTKNNFFSSSVVLLSVLLLTVLILFISYTIVGERVERHQYTVPEEQRLTMVEGADTINLIDDIEYADGVTAVSELFSEDGEHLAYVIDAVSGGADGDVVVRIAFDEDDCISIVDVLETAALPTNLGFKAASREYLNQYIGASEVTSYAGSVSGRLIKSIDGAEYSCSGVYSCVTAAFTQLAELREMQEEEE